MAFIIYPHKNNGFHWNQLYTCGVIIGLCWRIDKKSNVSFLFVNFHSAISYNSKDGEYTFEFRYKAEIWQRSQYYVQSSDWILKVLYLLEQRCILKMRHVLHGSRLNAIFLRYFIEKNNKCDLMCLSRLTA